jgi:hypothetical protein
MPSDTYLMPDFMNRDLPVHYTTALNILAQMGVEASRIDLMAVGRYQNYRGEIQSQEPASGAVLMEDTQIVLKIGVSSAVDFMPYQFFQGAGASWEDRAREFMAPFDAASMRRTAESHLQTLRYNLGLVDRDYLARLLQLFHFRLNAADADTGEALMWAALFPRFHEWSGNPRLVTHVLQQFFPWKFTIDENVPSEYPIPPDLQYRLGSRMGRLGQETVVGKSFTECDSTYELVISEVQPEEAPQLFPGAAVRSKIEWLIETCMPGNLDCRITIKVVAKGSRLGKEHGHTYLGYAVFAG